MKFKNHVYKLLGVFVLLAVLGCHTQEKLVLPPSNRSEEYLSSLKSVTGVANIYDQFETKILAHASLRNQTFLDAAKKEYARIYPSQMADAELISQYLVEPTLSVLVTLSSREFEEGDPTAKKNGWKFYLKTGTALLEPVNIKKVPIEHTMIKSFFPYVTEFDHTFILVFDKPMDFSVEQLILTGPLGKAEISLVKI